MQPQPRIIIPSTGGDSVIYMTREEFIIARDALEGHRRLETDQTLSILASQHAHDIAPSDLGEDASPERHDEDSSVTYSDLSTQEQDAPRSSTKQDTQASSVTLQPVLDHIAKPSKEEDWEEDPTIEENMRNLVVRRPSRGRRGIRRTWTHGVFDPLATAPANYIDPESPESPNGKNVGK